MKVAVGMSGGVDSSTVALLLKEKGYDIIGITLKMSSIECSIDGVQVCCSPDDVKDAKKVADYLGIEHYVIDWEDLFREKVINYFVNAYKKGLTPNPCAICNREVKTGLLAIYVREVLGVDKLATGHYIKLEKNKNLGFILKRGKDLSKDQSYFMALVKKEILNYLIFPLGNYLKEEVRKIAENYSLPVSSKKDSFEICFTAGKSPAEYLKENKLYDFKEGDIIHISGKKLGKHKGLPFYTIGQRRGLGIRWKKPLYVIDKDVNTNTVIVGEREYLLTKKVEAENLNLFVDPKYWDKNKICIQGRYRQKCLPISDFSLKNNKVEIYFKEPQEKFAKGQILAIYQNDILLGGGIII